MWRYISTSTETDPDRPIPVNARHYFDLSLLWEVNQYASLRIGVRNLFDKEPLSSVILEVATPSPACTMPWAATGSSE